MPDFEVSLGSITAEPNDTDEQLLAKAKAHLPEALRRMGTKTGEVMWKTTVDGFRGSSFKFDTSSSAKTSFVRDKRDQFVRKASSDTREKLVRTIFTQLQEQRDRKRATPATP